MQVNLNGSTPDPLLTEKANESATQAPELKHQHAEDKATLSLGQDSTDTLVSQAMTTSATRQDKIEALCQAISSGQYKVEPEKVAEAMLNESAKPESGS